MLYFMTLQLYALGFTAFRFGGWQPHDKAGHDILTDTQRAHQQPAHKN